MDLERRKMLRVRVQLPGQGVEPKWLLAQLENAGVVVEASTERGACWWIWWSLDPGWNVSGPARPGREEVRRNESSESPYRDQCTICWDRMV